VRRQARLLRARSVQADLAPPYFIKRGYVERETVELGLEHSRTDEVVWQPDVYRAAAIVAARLGARRIIDLGCGNGRKLVELHPAFELVGIDVGANIAGCRERYAVGTWLEHDLDQDASLPLAREQLEGAVLVAADVIEHLHRPELLLRVIREALDVAEVAIVSTPERLLTHGVRHAGPPPNRKHVREWALDELAAFLAAEGFEHGTLGLTRSNDREGLRDTILALLCRNEASLREIGRAPSLGRPLRRLSPAGA
jgi:2-polyprenyl-3-methyl-5-hydroxy-6-metoxy-1,4-benzoquinol methylase